VGRASVRSLLGDAGGRSGAFSWSPFWRNALIVTFLNAVLAGLVARAVYRSWRNRQLGIVGTLRAAPGGPILAVVAAMVCYHQLAKRLALPAIKRDGLVVPDEVRPGDDEPGGAAQP
jgi:hypothetical protein